MVVGQAFLILIYFYFRYLNAGGYPQDFVELLAENYHGMAQLANLLADWLIVAGIFFCLKKLCYLDLLFKILDLL